MPSASSLYAVSGSQLIKLIESVTSLVLKKVSLRSLKQAGTAPSRRHIQGSKIAKRLPSVKYSLLQYSKIENFSIKKFFGKITYSKKMDQVARRGPLARAPGALKGVHFRNCQHFCRS